MSNPLPDRPEFIPQGYEWLREAYKRDVEPHGAETWETVRQALAEGNIEAKILDKFGSLENVQTRMWRKRRTLVDQFFQTGWMTMTLVLYTNIKFEGHLFVKEGALAKIIAGTSDNGATKRQHRGRRPKYDWAAFQAEIARKVGTDPDGFPVLQADLEEEMTKWCERVWGEDKCPVESTIREQVSIHYSDEAKAGN